MVRINAINWKDETIKDAAEKLLNNGYRVFINNCDNHKKIFFYYVKDDNIAYCQVDFGGLNLSSVHKANKSTGTGFRITDEPLPFLTPKLADNAFFKPTWARNMASERFKNWEEYRKQAYLEYTEVEL
jgi:hypothetical protein